MKYLTVGFCTGDKWRDLTTFAAKWLCGFAQKGKVTYTHCVVVTDAFVYDVSPLGSYKYAVTEKLLSSYDLVTIPYQRFDVNLDDALTELCMCHDYRDWCTVFAMRATFVVNKDFAEIAQLRQLLTPDQFFQLLSATPNSEVNYAETR